MAEQQQPKSPQQKKGAGMKLISFEHVQKQRASSLLATAKLPVIKLTTVDVFWTAEAVIGSYLVYKGWGTTVTQIAGATFAGSTVLGVGGMMVGFGLARIANFLEEEVNVAASVIMLTMLSRAGNVTPQQIVDQVKSDVPSYSFQANVADPDGSSAQTCQWFNTRLGKYLTGDPNNANTEAGYCADAVKRGTSDAKFCECKWEKP